MVISSTSVKNLSEFLSACVINYGALFESLSKPIQDIVNRLPPCLKSKKIGVYILQDGVFINDEMTTPLASSFRFAVLEKRINQTEKSEIQVLKLNASMSAFTSEFTFNVFKFEGGAKQIDFGKPSSLSFMTFEAGPRKRYVGETLIFGYLDQSGWDRRWAWHLAKEILQRNVDSSILRLILNSGISNQQEIQKLGQKEAALVGVERIRHVVSHFENLLRLYPDQENKFQQLFELNPYLLSSWGKVTPKPFLRFETTTGSESWRVPDFLITELDESCTLVEIESPSKPIFTEGKDPRQTQYVTQAENQVRQWDQIIRRNPEIVKTYPGIEYYRSRIVIGRSYHTAFPSYAAFQAELETLSAQKSKIHIETYDVRLEEARAFIGFLEMIISGIPLPSVR